MKRTWQVTLGDGRVFTEQQWMALDMQDRRRHLVNHAVASFAYVPSIT